MLAAVQYKLDGETKQIELEMDEAKRNDEEYVQKLVQKEVKDDRAELISYREL
ncbi:hypothetical protein [Alkalicoccus urumqiensis]|uniref:hypothetical protein n=1 Tax=Alkalicoccus urumqiensis TaxID=1548213 RepID=UPI0015E5DA3B|nr:hypothetical protein [Alkalicoccus urumqiensis]